VARSQKLGSMTDKEDEDEERGAAEKYILVGDLGHNIMPWGAKKVANE